MVTSVFWPEDAGACLCRDHSFMVVDWSNCRFFCKSVAFRGMVTGTVSGLGDFRNYSEWYDSLSKLIFICVNFPLEYLNLSEIKHDRKS